MRIAVCFQFIILLSCTIRNSEDKSEKNRLTQAGSPYLQEHADNPVDWYEWSSEALDKAKNENKPLIISIGYASCHWCHVMERESFMDTAVARIMNENFVSIKIDREERPDIDQVYLQAAQLISGNGGWPLNAFALPDGKPFYAATYFPKEQWIALLKQVSKAYKTDNENVVRQAEALTNGVRSYDVITTAKDSTQDYNENFYRDILVNAQSLLDYKDGGLSGSPKFPMPVVWEFLLQSHYLTGDKKSLEMVALTLDNMAAGGIFDHLAGGFARYSTDPTWKVPHFEKMLYDNGQLMSLYAHAYQATGDSAYAHIVRKTHDFIRNELTSPEGGFYSSVNADSEGTEGKFYVWTKAEIEKTLGQKESGLFIEYYQVTDSGNWENEKNILHRRLNEADFAKQKDLSPAEVHEIIGNAESKLLNVRNKRIRPSVDDKILLSWNALMTKGYIDAYFAFGNPEYLEVALKNARLMEKNMIRQDGRLWRNYKDGKASTGAFLDDYALLADVFIQLYQATFDIAWLDKAKTVTLYAVAHFRDEHTGLFYYTSDESENLVARKMELADNVIPSSNSVMAKVLFLLGEYYDIDVYTRMSVIMLNQVTKDIVTSGLYYSNWASLMGMITYQPYEVAIVGQQALEKSKQMREHYIPTAIFMGGNGEDLPLLEDKKVKGKTMIYVCRNKTCKLPEEVVDRALKQMKQITISDKKL